MGWLSDEGTAYRNELARAEAAANAGAGWVMEPGAVLRGETGFTPEAYIRDLAELAEDMYAALYDVSEACAEDGFLDRLAELGLEVEL